MTSSRKLLLAFFFLTVLAFAPWRHSRDVEEWTVLSFRIGQSFEDVISNSTYPVIERSNIPTAAYLHSGETYVTKPAVVLVFNDPKHGFRLPVTKFGMVSYMHNKVETVATSPMVEKLPFDQAVSILEDLQNQFRAGGWEPWSLDGSLWFDLSPDGKRRLYAKLLQPDFSHEATLRVPGKYGMIFRIWCAEGCHLKRPPYLFLIDIGVSEDLYDDFSPDLEPMPPRGY